MVSVQHSSLGRTVRVALLLVTEPDRESTIHCTVVPLFTGVAGTVRMDCTVPDDDDTAKLAVIPRSTMTGSVSVTNNPPTRHRMVTPLPLQWNRAFSPTSALTDTGPSVSARVYTKCKQEDTPMRRYIHTGSTRNGNDDDPV